MPLQLRPIQSSDVDKIKSLYIEAFPPNERAPFWLLSSSQNRKNVHFYSFYNQNDWVGFTYLVTDNAHLIVWYIAISDKVRGKGYGGKALQAIKEQFPNHNMSLLIESPDDPLATNKKIREKRKSFYLKHQFVDTGFVANFGEDVYDILAYGQAFQKDHYILPMKRFFGPLFGWFAAWVLKCSLQEKM